MSSSARNELFAPLDERVALVSQRVSWDDFDVEVRVAARRRCWLLPAQHDAVASDFGSVALRHMQPDSSPNASGRSPVELGEPLFE